MCTSDLSRAAAAKLLEDLSWDPNTIEALVVLRRRTITRRRHRLLRAERLGIPTSCAAFDMALGCSGYIYGLWVCSILLAAGSVKRAPFLVGDTMTWVTSPHDHGTAFLFWRRRDRDGSGGDDRAPPMSFVAGTDGRGQGLPDRTGYRNRITAETIERRTGADGVLRSPLDLYRSEGARQRQVLVAFGILDFVDANGVDGTQRSMLVSPGDAMIDRVENFFPGKAKCLGRANKSRQSPTNFPDED